MTHRIKYWRDQRGLSQGDLAERLGLGYHQSTVANIESGRRKLQVGEMKLFAHALEVDELDLLPLAVLADIETDVVAATSVHDAAIEAAFEAKGLLKFRVTRNTLSLAGVKKDALVVGDTSADALRNVADGAIVIADATVPSEDASARVMRQYLRGGLLTTNRQGRNASFSIQDPDYKVKLVAVVLKSPPSN